MAVKHGPCLLTLRKKDPGFRDQVLEETSLHLLLEAQDQRLDAESSWIHKSFFWQLARDRNSHGSGMSYATTASQKLCFGGTLEGGRRRGRRKC